MVPFIISKIWVSCVIFFWIQNGFDVIFHSPAENYIIFYESIFQLFYQKLLIKRWLCSCVELALWIVIAFTIFNKSGNSPVKIDILIMWAEGNIIRSGIADNSSRGILEGHVDLFSSEFIISSISSLDTWAITKFIWLRFCRNLDGIY